MKNYKFIITISVLCLMLFFTTYVVLILPKADNVQGKANIALVNEDIGYQNGEMSFDFGYQFTTSLSNSDENNVTVTSRTDALEQLELDKYDLVLIVPQQFSSDIMSYDSEKPQNANIEYYVNPNSSKIDFLNNTLAKENIQELINTNVNKAFTKEIMHKIDDMKTSSQEVFDSQVDYQKEFDNNVRKPFLNTNDEFDNVLSSVASQQSTISNFGSQMFSYESQVDGNITATKETEEDFVNFYDQILENRSSLSEVQTFYSNISNDLTSLKNIYESSSATSQNLNTFVQEMKVNNANLEVVRLENNDFLNNGLLANLNINNTVKTRLENSEELTVIIEDLRNVHVDNPRALSYIDELENDLLLLGNISNSTQSSPMPVNDVFTRVEAEVTKSCEQLGSSASADTVAFCNNINVASKEAVNDSGVKIEVLVSTTYNKTVSEMNQQIQSMPCFATQCKVTDLKSTLVVSRVELKSAYISMLDSKISALNNLINYFNSVNSQLEFLTSGSIDSGIIQYNDVTKTYDVGTIDTSNIDSIYLTGSGKNNETITSIQDFSDNMSSLNENSTSFINTYGNLIGTSGSEFNSFLEFYDGQGGEAALIIENQQKVIDDLVKLSSDSKVQAKAVEVIQSDGAKIEESATVASSNSAKNKASLDKTSTIYNELVEKNKEYVTGFSNEYSSSKLGSRDNDKFFDNYSNPVSFIDNGEMFNFGSIIPFLIVLLLAFYTIVISFIYNQFKATHVSDSDHEQSSVYKSNLKQLIFIVSTGLIASVIVAYIGAPAVSLTNSMAIVWFASIISIGIALTLLFYMLLTRLNSLGMIIIGVIMIIYIITNSILDLVFNGKIASILKYINPLSYFESFMKKVVYGASLDMLMFVIVIIVMIGASVALIITNNTRTEKHLNEAS